MNQFYPRETNKNTWGVTHARKPGWTALVEKQTGVATETAAPHSSCTGALLEISNLFPGSSVEHHPVCRNNLFFRQMSAPRGHY